MANCFSVNLCKANFIFPNVPSPIVFINLYSSREYLSIINNRNLLFLFFLLTNNKNLNLFYLL